MEVALLTSGSVQARDLGRARRRSLTVSCEEERIKPQKRLVKLERSTLAQWGRSLVGSQVLRPRQRGAAG